jgi:hypothetical protein
MMASRLLPFALSTALNLIAPFAAAGELPDPVLTPGIARDGLTLQAICNTKWGEDKRLVTEAMKKQVMASYHMTEKSCPSGKIEIDHLISRELGGADVVGNLWPQCYEAPVLDPAHPGKNLPPSKVPEWGAHKKDRLEDDFGKRICLPMGNPKHLELEQARAALRTNWVLAYIVNYGDPRAASAQPTH